MSSQTRDIVFINGAWMASACWDLFKLPFEHAGFRSHTLEWPHLDGPVREMRSAPPAEVGGLSINSIVAHHAAFIRSLPEAPVLVGHSFGGLFVELLLDAGLGCAGVALDPAPIGGIVPGPITFKAALPVIARASGWKRPYTLTKQQFDSSFANTAPSSLRDEAYERLVVPTSGLMFYQNAFWIDTFVNPARRTAPLLITSATDDHTVSPYVCRAAYRRQSRSRAPTDMLSFPQMSHFLIAEPGWERVAAPILAWLVKHVSVVVN
jgi:pimeloyl-ACP methyl ester carboxylesterase